LIQQYSIDPLADRRWSDFVAKHREASVFHQTGWLKALAETYGYRPKVITFSPPDKSLTDGVVFCEVKSWVTGKRLVSLPFADHSEPLLDSAAQIPDFEEWMQTEPGNRQWKYIEVRPLSGDFRTSDVMKVSQSFWMHTLDLSPTSERIFQACHKSCIQRRIIHAERQELSYERGRSDSVLDAFYRLLVITRQRHNLLPQPFSWFRNLLRFMGPDLEIRVLRSNDVPIASVLTLRHRNTVVFKYGCSDQRFHRLGGMPLLFWRLIEESKAEGASQIDFGRTEPENVSLVRFKDRLGARRKQISYLRYSLDGKEQSAVGFSSRTMMALSSTLPAVFSTRVGSLVYRHLG